MQLQAHGHPLHTRTLTITATVMDHGRWQVRGDVVDLRKCSFVPMVDDIQPAGIIHQMSITLELDPAVRRIDHLEVEQPHVAVDPSEVSRGECCRDPAPRLKAMIGEVIDGGFTKRLGLEFGGPLGCSHLLTLFQLMANALPPAFDREAKERAKDGATRRAGERPYRRAIMIDGFESESGDIGLAVQLGDYDTRPSSEIDGPMARLLREHDVRMELLVDQNTRQLKDWRVAERTRGRETLATAEWSDRVGELAELDGVPIAPGLARRVLTLLAGRDDRFELRDALLQLAPGYVQVLAAISERYYSTRPKKTEATEAGKVNDGSAGGVEMLGGMADSCYMWRSDGPLSNQRESIESGVKKAGPRLPGASSS